MGMVIMKYLLKVYLIVIEYIFYRISKRYGDDVCIGGLYMGAMLWGFVMEPILCLNNIPVSYGIEITVMLFPSLLGTAIGSTQRKRYERLCEKYRYEEIENPFYELCVFLVWGLFIGSLVTGICIVQMR